MLQQVFISSAALQVRSIREILDKCQKFEISAVEFTAGLSDTSDVVQELQEVASAGIEMLVHNYFPPPAEKDFVLNLASTNRELLALSLGQCKRAIDLCGLFGIPFYSVHAGFAADLRPDQLGHSLTEAKRFPIEDALDVFVTSVRTLCDYGRARRVRILVENNVLSECNLIHGENKLLLGVTPNDMLTILEGVGSPDVGLLMDTGHLKVSAATMGFTSDEFINAVSEWVECLHLSENDGQRDTNEAFDESAWFLPILPNFAGIPWVIEVYNHSPRQLKECIKLVMTASNSEAKWCKVHQN